MLDKPICITDIETTGGSSKRDAITEIAIIKFFGGKIISEYKTLVNPNRSIPEFITAITGISNRTVQDAPYFDDVAEAINQFYEDSYFLAHNVLFDFSFVKHQLESSGYTFKPRILCSVKLSRALYPQERGHSLDKINNRNGIKTDGRHRAYADAMAVLDFMQSAARQHGNDA
ncbi:3'-5' exonuclease, partial [Candidatus Saccharibacteria bacterium]|nr:3'-5' exonuclease [Candidatus Saccharibacteria bacterium]